MTSQSVPGAGHQSLDPQLSREGREQAEALLDQFPPDEQAPRACYRSSPFPRPLMESPLDAYHLALAGSALGLRFVRAATVGAAPEFVAMIRELVEERLDPSAPRRTLGRLELRPECGGRCCLPNR